jgi:predicted metal-dependent peptidase
MYPEDQFCHDKLNIAQDHYINLRLKALGYKIPDIEGIGHLADPQYRGMSSMEIYHKLPKDGPKMDPKLKDILKSPAGMSKEEHAERIMNITIKAVILAEQANDAGSIPGDLRKNLEDVISPKLPWQTILQQFLTEFVNEDYSMRRPNRRFMPGWYLPTLQGEGMGHLVIYGDVSGSMWGVVEEVWSEFKYIFDTMKPTSAHVMTGDTKIQLDKTYDMGDELDEWELTGGGGTVVQPVIDVIVEENPVFALLFTDGYFPVPDMSQVTDTEIFWVIKDNPRFKPVKGHVIPFE